MADLSFLAGASEEDLAELQNRVVDQYVKENFGAYAWALEDPELGPILRQAAEERWTAERFRIAVEGTNWYTNRTASQRTWDTLEASDETEATRRLQVEKQRIRDLALTTFGAGVIGEQGIEQIAKSSLRNGLSADAINGLLLFYAGDKVGTGNLAADRTAIEETARRFMLNLSDKEATDLTRRLFRGETTLDAIEETMKERAKSKYPTLAELLDGGTDLATYFGDHKATIANMMGMGVEQVDLVNDKQWRKVLSFADDDGKIRPMTTAETEQFIRTTDAYWQTRAGRAESGDLKLQLASMMGVR